jgi:hypothetical protein
MEPSIEELHVAWTDAIASEEIPGAASETLLILKELRNRKYTWFGKRECELRIVLNKYISYRENQRYSLNEY